MRLNCSIAISTYQAGKLIFLSPKDEDSLVQLPRSFEKPMGIAYDRSADKLALACRNEVLVFGQSTQLATHYPAAPERYDSLFLPRATYHTGALDWHDLAFGENGQLFGVNTLFSCLARVDDAYNFTPVWKPGFIDAMVSEDRCHLNGMAMQNGRPKYVTAFGTGNSFQSWRTHIPGGGILMDVDSGEIVLEGLSMPHSPRIFGDDLYVLLSATGELIRVNPDKRSYEVIVKLDGFVRGMDLYRDYLFIGLSKLRRNSSTFGKLEFADKARQAGIVVIHLPTAAVVGQIGYQSSVDEIYDVLILPDKVRPNILNTIRPEHRRALMIPDSTYWSLEPESGT